MKMRSWLLLCGFSALLASGCATTTTYTPRIHAPTDSGKAVAVFLDGTGNDRESWTNVSRLHDLMVNQGRQDMAVFYTEGVGSDGRGIGLAAGWGIGKDVREAYRFVAREYASHGKDKLYVFGFSRGAYTARILAGLIFMAGLPEMDRLGKEDAARFVDDLYDAYKGDKTDAERHRLINAVYRQWKQPRRHDVKIEVLGLWDTVEALGVPDYQENTGEVNRRYVDQVCNVKKAYHAMALDDNRARIYTPILLTSRHLNSRCPDVSIDEVVEEVWFAGAHADVGGGMREGFLSGVSLNWMISRLASHCLLPKDAAVHADPYDISHDAENASFIYDMAFSEQPRQVDDYLAVSNYNRKRLKVHESVLRRIGNPALVKDRLDRRKQEKPQLQAYESRWYNWPWFTGCFKRTAEGCSMIGNCVEEVLDRTPEPQALSTTCIVLPRVSERAAAD